MEIEIKELPAMRLAFMRHTGPYASPGIGRLWERFTAWTAAHGLGNDRHPMVGIGHDNPEVTPPDACRYDAAVEVDAAFVPDGAVQVQQIPAGRYALAPFEGTPADLGAAWWQLWSDLAREGWLPDARPGLELYPVNFRTDAPTGAFRCTLAVPVRPSRAG